MPTFRLENVVMALFVLLSALFGLELVHFFQSDQWILHAGAGGFFRWPQPKEQNLSVLLHSIGMLGWVGVVLYQLQSRGRFAHVMVGRVGGVLAMVALAFAWRPATASTVPALHAIGGLTLMDVTLLVNVLAIVEETLVGVLKARDRRIAEHRQHLMVAVMFTAAPGLYRAFRIALSWIFNLGDVASQSVLETVWLHELCACLAILTAIAIMLSRTFSGHWTVLRGEGPKRPRAPWHRRVAIGMLGGSVVLLILFGVWTADLIFFRFDDAVQVFDRANAPLWRLYF